MMHYVSEAAARACVSMADAITVVEQALLHLERGEAFVFPSVAATRPGWSNRFGCKLGDFAPSGPLGVKVGSYWPGNVTSGVANHGSTTLLLDDATGHPKALVRATWLNAIRTAAIDAVAVKHLARKEARTLGVIGAGHQAWFDVVAICAVRPIERVQVWSRDGGKAALMARRLADEQGLQAAAATLAQTCDNDIVVTATASNTPLVDRHWVAPGTHISAMGSDGPGKVELDLGLVSDASLFADLVSQSISLGEFEQAYLAGLINPADITTLGAVVAGKANGRASEEEITIFDSSGIALQDLAIAQLAFERAVAANRTVELN